MGEKHFDVMNDKWIKVEMIENEEIKKLSLKETILNAHKIRSLKIAGDTEYALSPSICEFAVFRFVSLFTQWVYSICNSKDIGRIGKKGFFDENTLNMYEKEFVEKGFSFDIYDKDYPFLQFNTNEFESDSTTSVAELTPLWSSGESSVFYNKFLDGTNRCHQDKCKMEDDELLINLIRYIFFPILCGGGYKVLPQAKQCSTPIYTLYESVDSLFKTILVNLSEINNEHIPFWEQKEHLLLEDSLLTPKDSINLYFTPTGKYRLVVVDNEVRLKKAKNSNKKFSDNIAASFFKNVSRMDLNLIIEEKEKKEKKKTITVKEAVNSQNTVYAEMPWLLLPKMAQSQGITIEENADRLGLDILNIKVYGSAVKGNYSRLAEIYADYKGINKDIFKDSKRIFSVKLDQFFRNIDMCGNALYRHYLHYLYDYMSEDKISDKLTNEIYSRIRMYHKEMLYRFENNWKAKINEVINQDDSKYDELFNELNNDVLNIYKDIFDSLPVVNNRYLPFYKEKGYLIHSLKTILGLLEEKKGEQNGTRKEEE